MGNEPGAGLAKRFGFGVQPRQDTLGQRNIDALNLFRQQFGGNLCDA